MFEKMTMAPDDPILGLNDAFGKDTNPKKINLGVGVYKDSEGWTPVFNSVKKAEERLLADEDTKDYLSITGLAAYNAAVQELLWGGAHEILTNGRAGTVQTPGGTGALRVAADFIHQHMPGATLWLSDPTWANHPKVFESAGVATQTYRYYNPETFGLDFDALIEDLAKIPAGDVVLLHGCCHNPTGVDPSPEQWEKIGDVLQENGVLPLLDFAYHGLGDGLDQDAAGLRALSRSGCEMFVATSYSKSFGLYRERIGALTVVAADTDATAKAMSHLKICVRTNYSNPPAHGAQIVATVLGDPALRALWDEEVQGMRDRINGMRRRFVDGLESRGVRRDFSFIAHQRGMFSFSGLTPDQVAALREKHSIYIVGSGRINVAGITDANIDPLIDAIAEVLKG
ncbi:MAG: aspartate aminotransferase [Candidatus Latescibacterota bacterium]|jgi:aspartate aminotransferase